MKVCLNCGGENKSNRLVCADCSSRVAQTLASIAMSNETRRSPKNRQNVGIFTRVRSLLCPKKPPQQNGAYTVRNPAAAEHLGDSLRAWFQIHSPKSHETTH